MRKEIRNWAIMIGIILFLYLTGLHTEVAAFTQRIVLKTGLITANTEVNPEESKEANYDFDLVSLDGERVNFSEFKNKVIFLNFWATWCPPCVAEMPDIQNLYDKVDNEDIVFVMLSMDRDMIKPNKFIKRKGYTFPVYMPADNIPDVFRSPSIPTTFVISPEGKIVSKQVGMANYDTKSFLKFLEKQALLAEK